MQPDNPFAPLPVEPVLPAGPLGIPAERAARFWAKLLDSLVIEAPILLAWLATTTLLKSDEDRDVISLFAGAVVGGPVLVWQAIGLATTGQTTGKRLLRIRVVNRTTGGPPGFLRGVLVRHVLMFAVNLLTCGLTQVYHVIDPLFIFRDDRRCLHDMLAGTVVVVA